MAIQDDYSCQLWSLKVEGMHDDFKFDATSTYNGYPYSNWDQQNLNKHAMIGWYVNKKGDPNFDGSEASKICSAIEKADADVTNGKMKINAKKNGTPIFVAIAGHEYKVSLTLTNTGAKPWTMGTVSLIGSPNPKTWILKALVPYWKPQLDSGYDTAGNKRDAKDCKPILNCQTGGGLLKYYSDWPAKIYWKDDYTIWPPDAVNKDAALGDYKLIKGAQRSDYFRGATDLMKAAGNSRIYIPKGMVVLPGKKHTFTFYIKVPPGAPPPGDWLWGDTHISAGYARPPLLMAQFALAVQTDVGLAHVHPNHTNCKGANTGCDPGLSGQSAGLIKNVGYGGKAPIQFAITPVDKDAGFFKYVDNNELNPVPKVLDKPKTKTKASPSLKCNESGQILSQNGTKCVCKPGLEYVNGACECVDKDKKFNAAAKPDGKCECHGKYVSDPDDPNKCKEVDVGVMKCNPDIYQKVCFAECKGEPQYKKYRLEWSDCASYAAAIAPGDTAKQDQILKTLYCDPHGIGVGKDHCGQVDTTTGGWKYPKKKTKKCGLCRQSTLNASAWAAELEKKYGPGASKDGKQEPVDDLVSKMAAELIKDLKNKQKCALKKSGVFVNDGLSCTLAMSPDLGFGQVCKNGKCVMQENPPGSSALKPAPFSGIGYNNYFLAKETTIGEDTINFEQHMEENRVDLIRLLFNKLWMRTTTDYKNYGKPFDEEYRARNIYKTWKPINDADLSKVAKEKKAHYKAVKDQGYLGFYLGKMREIEFFGSLKDHQVVLLGIYDELSRYAILKAGADNLDGKPVYEISFDLPAGYGNPAATSAQQTAQYYLEYPLFRLAAEQQAKNEKDSKVLKDHLGDFRTLATALDPGFIKRFIGQLAKNIENNVISRPIYETGFWGEFETGERTGEFEDFNFNLSPLAFNPGPNDAKTKSIFIKGDYNPFADIDIDEIEKCLNLTKDDKKDETALFFAYHAAVDPAKLPADGLGCGDQPSWNEGKRVLMKQQILNLLTKEANEDVASSRLMNVRISIETGKKISNEHVETPEEIKEILGKAGFASQEEKEILLKKFMAAHPDGYPTGQFAPMTRVWLPAPGAPPQTTPSDEVNLSSIASYDSKSEESTNFESLVEMEEKKIVTASPAAVWDPDIIDHVLDDAVNSIDAAFNILDGDKHKIYFFQGDNYYRASGQANPKKIDPGYPKKISLWPPADHVHKDGPLKGATPKGVIPNNLDAALYFPILDVALPLVFSNTPGGYQWQNSAAPVFFFKGLEVWIYDFASDSIRWRGPINKIFPGLPSNINAAFIWPGNKTAYFFKGKQYWKWDSANWKISDESPRLIAGKPKDDDGWVYQGWTSGVDLANFADIVVDGAGKTYFFKGTRYYELKSAGTGLVGGSTGLDIATHWKTADAQGIPKKTIKQRNWKDVLDGKFANIELVGYRVIKHRGPPTSGKYVASDIIQSFFVPFDPDSKSIDILDTQVKYNKDYYYSVMAIIIVHGTKYRYHYASDEVTEVANDLALQGLGTPKFFFRVEHEPRTRMFEVPLVRLDDQLPVRIMDPPPLPPLFKIHSYRDENNKTLISFNRGLGYVSRNIEHYPLDEIEEWNNIWESLVGSSSPPPPDLKEEEMIFSGETKIKKFLLYRLEIAPKKVQDFLNTNPTVVVPSSPFHYDDIIPNRKYYYAARSQDVHGSVSFLSDIYQVELVDDGGTIFLIVGPYQIKEEKEKIKVQFKKKIRIKPAFLQAAPNKDRIKPGADERVVGHMDLTDSVFVDNNAFKIRITSNKTKRKVDLNVRFIKNKLKTDEAPELNAKKIFEWVASKK